MLILLFCFVAALAEFQVTHAAPPNNKIISSSGPVTLWQGVGDLSKGEFASVLF